MSKILEWVDGEDVVRDMTQVELDEQAENAADRLEEKRAKMSLSFAQLLIGLVTETWITEAAGQAWLTGTLPANVEVLIGSLPAEQRFAARAKASRPSIVMRTDSLVLAIATAEGKTTEELDTFFLTYAAV